MKLIEEMLGDVQRFNTEVVGVPIPDELQFLSEARGHDKAVHLQEELDEFRESINWENQADALVDLIYVALGALVEMGVTPGSVFNEVHDANMKKVGGIKPERADSQFDAIKPDGWTSPDLKAAAIPLSILRALSPVLMDITALRIERGKTYNAGSVQLEDYFPLGDASYYQMVHLKLLRAKSIMEGCAGDMSDSILDMLNYAVFWAEFKRDGGGV